MRYNYLPAVKDNKMLMQFTITYLPMFRLSPKSSSRHFRLYPRCSLGANVHVNIVTQNVKFRKLNRSQTVPNKDKQDTKRYSSDVRGRQITWSLSISVWWKQNKAVDRLRLLYVSFTFPSMSTVPYPQFRGNAENFSFFVIWSSCA